PCAAKKLEASRRSIRSDIDFVLTFEELLGMLEAKEIDISALEDLHNDNGSSADGRGFAVGGGVANAVANCIRHLHPDQETKIERAEGLDNCRKMMLKAKAGKLNGYLLEGMACPGGCVGGAGTIQPISKAAAAVGKSVREGGKAHAYDSDYRSVLPSLEER
ncbi:MAG: iron hydrogenase, partial [Oscillospiraceae bacterium]|nr:iron hydrogenase [Oscillospiraceae bacterium]